MSILEIEDKYTNILQDKIFELEKQLELQKRLSEEQDRRIEILKQKVDENSQKGLIDVDIGDPIPANPDQRKEYVMRVAGFHRDILEAKIMQMISVFHKLLENEENDQKTNHYLQVGVFILRDLDKWGSSMINEAIAYQASDDAKNLIQ